MLRSTILLFVFSLLAACQFNPVQEEEKSQVVEYLEILDVTVADDMQQIGASPMENGYLYTITNDGVVPTNPNLERHVVILELNGMHDSQRLNELYPVNCQQLDFSQEVVDGYATWLDILACGEYGQYQQGLLVINKAIQTQKKHYSSIFYHYMPAFRKRVSHYRELPLTPAQIEDIDQFIQQTRIRREPL